MILAHCQAARLPYQSILRSTQDEKGLYTLLSGIMSYLFLIAIKYYLFKSHRYIQFTLTTFEILHQVRVHEKVDFIGAQHATL